MSGSRRTQITIGDLVRASPVAELSPAPYVSVNPQGQPAGAPPRLEHGEDRTGDTGPHPEREGEQTPEGDADIPAEGERGRTQGQDGPEPPPGQDPPEASREHQDPADNHAPNGDQDPDAVMLAPPPPDPIPGPPIDPVSQEDYLTYNIIQKMSEATWEFDTTRNLRVLISRRRATPENPNPNYKAHVVTKEEIHVNFVTLDVPPFESQTRTGVLRKLLEWVEHEAGDAMERCEEDLEPGGDDDGGSGRGEGAKDNKGRNSKGGGGGKKGGGEKDGGDEDGDDAGGGEGGPGAKSTRGGSRKRKLPTPPAQGPRKSKGVQKKKENKTAARVENQTEHSDDEYQDDVVEEEDEEEAEPQPKKPKKTQTTKAKETAKPAPKPKGSGTKGIGSGLGLKTHSQLKKRG